MAQLAHLRLRHRERARGRARASRRPSAGRRRGARRALAEPAGNAALCADIARASLPRVCVERAAGDRREDLLEAVGAVALEQLGRLALLDQAALVHDRRGARSGARPPPSGAWSRGSSCRPARAAPAGAPTPAAAPRGRGRRSARRGTARPGRLSSAVAISRRRSMPPDSVRARRSSIASQVHRRRSPARCAACARARHAGDARVEVEVLARGQRAVDGDRLRDVADRRAHREALRAHVEAGDERAAGARRQQRREHADRRRLAGAVGPEQAEHLARRDRE